MIPIVLGVIYSLEFPTAPSWDHSCFNIFLNDLFLIVKDVNVASYADGNTVYDSSNTIGEVILSLQSSSKTFFNGYQIIR